MLDSTPPEIISQGRCDGKTPYSSGVAFYISINDDVTSLFFGSPKQKLGGEQLRERLVTLEICLFGGSEKNIFLPNGGETW